ncbi:MAG TPA: glutamine-hydrolyzing carbamoyl-phosphate synthase small subunit [Dehalococcoidia bacterium]|nr:glutamine-hydrolyzing carbamoyl-phosphate synthase small subunit [Dehalococcoidia bacterium]
MTASSSKKAILVLEDGTVYQGYSFGAEVDTYGEVVFNTSMMGYQEMLTDPSYAGQIVVPTYPMVGNYGINRFDFESDRIQVRGFVVREDCHLPSHWQSGQTLHQYLAENGIPGIAGLDTRALARRLRVSGVMMGFLSCTLGPEEALARLKSLPRYDETDFVKEVGAKESYRLEPDGEARYHIVVVDCGVKRSILRILRGLGCALTVVPPTTPGEDILRLGPDGVVVSPGPGDPALPYLEAVVRALVGRKPIMGICLGHQLLGRVFGGRTFKLKFGHRGGNHPVRDTATGQVYITAQNHGYAVDAESLGPEVEITRVSLNDGTVEGLAHHEYPVLSIQYHSEASPGPRDTLNSFEQFLEMVERGG